MSASNVYMLNIFCLLESDNDNASDKREIFYMICLGLKAGLKWNDKAHRDQDNILYVLKINANMFYK